MTLSNTPTPQPHTGDLDLDARQRQRRRLLAAAAGLPLAARAQSATSATAAEPPPAAPLPPNVGRKFSADGCPLPFEGNTFLGHLSQQGEDYERFDAWLDMVREMPRHAFASKLTLVPPSSWHVTLIGGVNDVDRQTPAWPTDLPRDLPMAEVHQTLMRRLDERKAAPLSACRFVVDTTHVPSRRQAGALTVPLVPADEDTRRRVAQARDDLGDLMRLRRPDHNDYRFHVTVGYFFRFLDDAESEDLQASALDWRHRLAEAGPVTVHAFHFCKLRDMFAYREIRAV